MTGSLKDRTRAKRTGEPAGTGEQPTGVAAVEASSIYEWLRSPDQQAELLAALPRGVDGDRFVRSVITAVKLTPGLGLAAKGSVLGAVMQAAQLGLEPGPLDQVAITPDKRTVNGVDVTVATFRLTYKGVVELALRSPGVLSVEARTVYTDEEFVAQLGTDAGIWHTPNVDVAPGDQTGRTIRCFYGIVKYSDGGWYQRLMSLADIDDRRRLSPDPDGWFWTNHYEAMAHKTVLHAMRPYMRLTAETAAALDADEDTVDIADTLDDNQIIDVDIRQDQTTQGDSEDDA